MQSSSLLEEFETEAPRPTPLPWIQVSPTAPYFITEEGKTWTPIGQNDAITWPELRGLYLSAYQSDLWNRTLALYLRRLAPDSLLLVEQKRGVLPFPCKLTPTGWVNAITGSPLRLVVRPTHWRPHFELQRGQAFNLTGR